MLKSFGNALVRSVERVMEKYLPMKREVQAWPKHPPPTPELGIISTDGETSTCLAGTLSTYPAGKNNTFRRRAKYRPRRYNINLPHGCI
jgi:hypothetical protein